uniref:Uncharacterized protein n=1 Tax=Anguilla anguilla TaxID=7936 RepID=A0A0E9PQ07_ANGAN
MKRPVSKVANRLRRCLHQYEPNHKLCILGKKTEI